MNHVKTTIVLLATFAICAPTIASAKKAKVAKPSYEHIFGYNHGGVKKRAEKSLKCDSPGEMLVEIYPTNPGVYGTKCHKGGNVKLFNVGFTYGIMERLKKAGFNVETIRHKLAKPRNLRWFQKYGRQIMTSVLMNGGLYATTKERDRAGLEKYGYAWLNIVSKHGDGKAMSERGKDWVRGFLARRAAEAKPKDRQVVVNIWSEIIKDQFKIYVHGIDCYPQQYPSNPDGYTLPNIFKDVDKCVPKKVAK